MSPNKVMRVMYGIEKGGMGFKGVVFEDKGVVFEEREKSSVIWNRWKIFEIMLQK